MTGRGAEWPALSYEGGTDDFRLFSDGNVPPSFVRTWYDPGDTGLVEDPDPQATVTLAALGPYDPSEADMFRRANQSEDGAEIDELMDQADEHVQGRGVHIVERYRQFHFDPRVSSLIGGTEALEEARQLAAEVFAAAGIERPAQ